jgi:hypothetical protein
VTAGVLLHRSKLFKHPGAAAVLTIAGRLRAGQDIACEPLPACMKHEAQQHLDLQVGHSRIYSASKPQNLAVCPCTILRSASWQEVTALSTAEAQILRKHILGPITQQVLPVMLQSLEPHCVPFTVLNSGRAVVCTFNVCIGNAVCLARTTWQDVSGFHVRSAEGHSLDVGHRDCWQQHTCKWSGLPHSSSRHMIRHR